MYVLNCKFYSYEYNIFMRSNVDIKFNLSLIASSSITDQSLAIRTLIFKEHFVRAARLVRHSGSIDNFLLISTI